MPRKQDVQRTKATPRSANDDYQTDPRLALACMRRMADLYAKPEMVLEAHAGSGAFVRAAKTIWPDVPVTAVEIQEKYRASLVEAGADLIYIEDFETWIQKTINVPTSVLAIGNPPFALAEKHIQLMLDYLLPGSHISQLLKNNFLGGDDRAKGFWLSTAQQLDSLVPIAGRASFKTTDRAMNDWNELSMYTWKTGNEVSYAGRVVFPHIFWKDGKTVRGA